MVTVFNKDGRICKCTDIQILNKQIITETLVFPSTDEFIVLLSVARLLSKLDQMPITPESKLLRFCSSTTSYLWV